MLVHIEYNLQFKRFEAELFVIMIGNKVIFRERDYFVQRYTVRVPWAVSFYTTVHVLQWSFILSQTQL